MVRKSQIHAIVPSPGRLRSRAAPWFVLWAVAVSLGLSLATRRAAAAKEGRRPDSQSAALLVPIIMYHARAMNSSLEQANGDRGLAGQLTINGLRSVGSAAVYFYYSLSRTQPRNGIEPPDWAVARNYLLVGARGSFRGARNNIRDAEWQDLLARYHWAAFGYYDRLLTAGAMELPPLGPELVERRRALERAHLELFGTAAVLQPEPLKQFLPGYAPAVRPVDDPHRSHTDDRSF